MPKYIFARNTIREYFEVEADCESAARAAIKADETEHYTGKRRNELDESPFELIDIESE